MAEAVNGLTTRLKNYWGAFSVPQRTFAIIAAAALVLGAVVFVNWITRPTMTPVFSGLAATDAAAVVEELTARGVPYELTGGGSTVLVPAEQVYDLRIALAATGLPRQQDGYALLDDMGMASSDFQQQVYYQRALEGELARTVAAIAEIQAATVHLALPEESVFSDRAVDPTASVFVELAPNAVIDSNAVQAITTLVSSAVPNMRATGVAVIDSGGRDLTLTAGTGANATDHEQRIARQVQNMLEQVIGAGNAVVSVTAELNRDSTERLTETFSADDDIPPLSSSTVVEEYEGAGQAVGGVLGPDNIAVPGDGGDAGSYSREEEIVNNSVNKVTEQTIVTPGGVSRQSVSVVVDLDAASGIAVDQLEAMVAAAAGINEERGDMLAVTRTVFDTAMADAAQAALAEAEARALADAQALEAQQRADLIRNLAIAGALLLALIVYRVIRRARRRRWEDGPRDLGELQMLQNQPLLPSDPDAAQLDAIEDEVASPQLEAPEIDPDETIRSEVAALADENPEAVAERLREWLAVR